MKDQQANAHWGAKHLGQSQWQFAIWAPDATSVAVALGKEHVAMQSDGAGHWHLRTNAQLGQSYQFVIDGTAYPDPAAKRQKTGVHGPSVLTEIAEPCQSWQGRDWAEAVIFELHLGTFTQEGTLRAATQRLEYLAKLGITFVELMPIAQFHGQFGWGYDGVLPYALHDAYGDYDDLRDFIDRAHTLGMGVLLDVVYNHFGPEGAYLHAYCPQFFDADKQSPWGASFDFSRPEVRDFFLKNAEMWIAEVGFDGLRLDAVHAIEDHSEPHFIVALAQHLKGLDLGRPVHLIAEDERNLPDMRQVGIDAAWNDDYHHAVHCLTTGEAEAYYASFAVDPMADLCRAMRGGQVEEGQPRKGKDTPRGAPADHLAVTAFVNANQTHDQVGNRAQGERLIDLIGPAPMTVLHALLLTAPYVPMLFMGEETGSRAPFQFFCNFDGELAEAVRTGRAAEFAGFGGFAGQVSDPCAEATMITSRPYADLPDDAEFWQDWTATLLRYRAERIVPLIKTTRLSAHVDQVGPRALRATWRFASGTLHIAANLGAAPDQTDLWEDAEVRHKTLHDDYAFASKVIP